MKKAGLILFFVLVSLLFLHPINAGDFFTTSMNSGRYIVEHHALPYTDDMTFTAFGKPWVAYAWGSGLLFYFLYTTFGPVAINVLFTLIGAGSILCTYLTLRSLKISQYISIILTFLTGSLISLRFPTRPEVIGPCFIALLIYILVYDRKLTWKLPILFFLWSVMYGASTILGIAIIACFVVTQWLKPKDKRNFSLPIQITIVVLCILTSCANGFGLRSFFYIFQIPAIGPHVGEWLPIWATMDLTSPGLVLFYQYTVLIYLLFTLLWLMCLVSSFIMNRKGLRDHLFIFLLSFAIATPLIANRFVNLAPLLVAPMIGFNIMQTKKLLRIGLSVLIVLLALAATTVRFVNFSFGTGLEPSLFQNKAVSFIKSHHFNGNIYENQELGAFVSWELPMSKIFIDTRDDLFQPTGVFTDLTAVDSGHISITQLFNKYKADIVIGNLTNEGTFEPLFYDNGWRLVYLSDGYFVSVRTTLAVKYHLTTYDAIDPLEPDGAKPGMSKEATSELKRLIALDPTGLENRVRLIEQYLTHHNPSSAKSALQDAHISPALGPQAPLTNLATDMLVAKVDLSSHDCAGAQKALAAAQTTSMHTLIFFPTYVLPSPIDRYTGEYEGVCLHDAKRAVYYLTQYLSETNNPIEIRQIEAEIQTLNN